jgi:hypothetical protein
MGVLFSFILVVRYAALGLWKTHVGRDVHGGVGRGCGPGRDLGVGLTLGVAVGGGVTVGVPVGLGVELGVGVTVGVGCMLGVGVGVGVGPDSAQYLPPVSKLVMSSVPPQTIIWLPVQTAV